MSDTERETLIELICAEQTHMGKCKSAHVKRYLTVA